MAAATIAIGNKMDQEYINILNKYVSDVYGSVVAGVVESDVKLELNWTQNTWEDGIPVNKYFSRCENPLRITLKKGMEIAGAHYYGRSSGCHMFTFRQDETWYEAQKYDAEEILQSLGIDPEDM